MRVVLTMPSAGGRAVQQAGGAEIGQQRVQRGGHLRRRGRGRGGDVRHGGRRGGRGSVRARRAGRPGRTGRTGRPSRTNGASRTHGCIDI